MIGIRLNNHDYYNEAADIVRMYFGKCELERLEGALAESQSFLQDYEAILSSSLKASGDEYILISRYESPEKQEEEQLCIKTEKVDSKALKRLVKKSMYKLLSKVAGREYPWGILTGIRPVKIVHEIMDRGFSKIDIPGMLTEEYFMSEDRAQLSVEIAEVERPFVYPHDEKLISIYAGIPFCPSRCHYCSFTSNSIKTLHTLVEPYLASLKKEITSVSRYLNNEGYKVQTIYIGGGTPTALSADQLDRLLECLRDCFGYTALEFTCEAGRPDSITEEKLKALSRNKVDRISINPQTMSDATLKCIGRAHSTAQVIQSFGLARREGFQNINMDIILGLPGETIEELAHTLGEIQKLDPESITVHTMAIKRASIYNDEPRNLSNADDLNAASMMDYTKSFLRNMGMQPYYLYRQKHMLQNLENIGFSKKGFECIYNMQIIEDKQTIVAFGADAVTKIVINSENRIERQHNIKDVRLYTERIEEMIKNKIDILEQLRKTY